MNMMVQWDRAAYVKSRNTMIFNLIMAALCFGGLLVKASGNGSNFMGVGVLVGFFVFLHLGVEQISKTGDLRRAYKFGMAQGGR